jgi:hypothetical protein
VATHCTSWKVTTPTQTTPALIDEVGRWMSLNWLRAPADYLVVIAFGVAALCPRRGSRGSSQIQAAVLDGGKAMEGLSSSRA